MPVLFRPLFARPFAAAPPRTVVLGLLCLFLAALVVIDTVKDGDIAGVVVFDDGRTFTNPAPVVADKKYFDEVAKRPNVVIEARKENVDKSVVLFESDKKLEEQADFKDVQCHEGSVDLHPLSEDDLKWANRNGENNKMFLLETSGLSRLSPKAACAMESAARMTELSVIIMVFSKHLDLKDNTTCQLYKLSSEKNIRFYRIVPDDDLTDTPLHDLYNRGLFNSSKHTTVHLSDALRLAYVAKYGGWYADTDFVFIKPMVDMKNIVTLTAISEKAENGTFFHITTGAFNADKGHVMLQRYMEKFNASFKGKGRAEVGPMMLTRTVRELCRFPGAKLLIGLNDTNMCHGITVRHPDWFYPFRPYTAGKMWSPKEDREPKYWESWIKKDTLAVHFFGGLTRKRAATHDPKKDIYSYLAPRYCPKVYFSAEKFV